MKARRGTARFTANAVSGAIASSLVLSGPIGTAGAQGFGQPDAGQQPGFQQPGFQQPQFGQPPAGQPAFAPSMVGAWSAQRTSQFGPVQQTDAFSQDGRYVSVAVFQTAGLIARVWGTYRASPAGPNQLRVDLQMQGYLPQQICTQSPGAQPLCQPFTLPATDASMVTFTSPNSFQAISPINPATGIMTATRDQNPVLLQQQVAPQQLVNLPAPPPSGYIGPAIQTPAYNVPSSRVSRCDDTQTRTSCAITGGRLVVSDGCLVCL